MEELESAVTARLSEAAWRTRQHARVLGNTRVGAAALGAQGGIWTGCNVEHKFRSHDIHAEVNAIGSMVAAGELQLRAIFVAAERERFSPCGACLDWIFEFGGSDCLVLWQGSPNGRTEARLAGELMPHYPF